MDVTDTFELFDLLDLAAVSLLLLGYLAISWRVEHPSPARPSTSNIMADYRSAWMVQMVTRQPRIFDAHILGTLRQGTAFFASTCVIAIGGTLALMGNAERLAGVTTDITLTEHPAIVLEIKMLVLLLFLTNGFLKFVWSNRLFGYCSVVMGAVPNDPADPRTDRRAEQTAQLNITAARSFNRGLRAIYFALAAVSWIAGPIPLILATLVTIFIIWRREFASHSRKILLDA